VIWGRDAKFDIFMKNEGKCMLLEKDNKKWSTAGLGKYGTPKKSYINYNARNRLSKVK